MFGTYRTLLALMVVFNHLGDVPMGGYAVFGFYILSGYLMTLIMQKTYGYKPGGLAKYAVNRFLKIYPVYWLSCILSFLLMYWLGDAYTSAYHRSMFAPSDLYSWLRNLTLLFPNRENPRLTPPAWALTVELFFYGCIGLGASKTRARTMLWFAASVLYTVVINALGLGWDLRYFPISAASLPFSTGSLIYHFRGDLNRVMGLVVNRAYAPTFLMVFILVNWTIGYLTGHFRDVNFYINYALCALMMLSLCEREALPFITRKFDKTMGDFSYPIYLIHYQTGLIAVVAMNYLGVSIHRPDLRLAFVSLPFIFMISWLLTVLLERPIEKARERVKLRY